jgi:putative flippase GtrA
MKIVDFAKFHLERAFKSSLVGAEGALVQIAITFTLTEFLQIWYIYSVAIGILVAFAHNYHLNYYWAFKDVIQNDFSDNPG